MASKSGLKMSTYSQSAKTETVTYWELYERAAKARYGRNIIVSKTQFHETQVRNIDFEVTVVEKDTEPRESTRTIVDINMKEYENHGEETQDESIVQVTKTSSETKGNRYSFSTTKGVEFGAGGSIGAQVVGAAVAGGSFGLNAEFKKSKSTTKGTELSNETELSFCYHQEEKITVPPKKRVKAKITTFRMKYEMDYVLKFSVKKNVSIPVLYKTNCQQCFFGCCKSRGSVRVSDMINSLPNYNGNDENNTASFTQAGTISWLGEGCSVKKVVESLHEMI